MKALPEIPPVVGFLVVAAVIVGLVCSVTPQETNTPAPVVTASPQENTSNPVQVMQRLRVLVQQTRGNWNRLSMSDRQLLDGLTAGHGAAMFRSVAQERNVSKKLPGHKPD